MRGERHVNRTVLLIAGLLLLTGCGSSSQPASSTGGSSTDLGEIKVGTLYTLTGGNAGVASDALHGTQLAADVLNGKYPNINLPKLTSRKVVLDSADTQGNPQIGAAAVDRLIQTDHAVSLVGGFESAVSLTASQRSERYGVPFVVGSSSSTSLTERGLKWFFRPGPSDLIYTQTFFDWMKAISKEHPVQRVVALHTNDQFGNDGASVVSTLAARYAIKVEDDISFQPQATDLTSVVQKLRADSSDAVFIFCTTNDAVLLIKTLAQLGYTPPVMLGAGYSTNQFISALGHKADDTVFRAAWTPQVADKNPVAKQVADQFLKNYGQPMTEFSARDFTAMMVLGAAIQKASSSDPEKIRRALTGLNLSKTIMPWQGVKFDNKGQNVYARGVVTQLTNGEYSVLYPTDVATAKVVWPAPPLQNR
ncbi:MAG: hypothetical protein DLM66_11825 [Candidatus Dormiibacter spiritus]|nr:MAG: hypothetical protein DLM66_11825 [Candidatus Dormibacteraeota bacterium]